jgi:hypothetical protein
MKILWNFLTQISHARGAKITNSVENSKKTRKNENLQREEVQAHTQGENGSVEGTGIVGSIQLDWIQDPTLQHAPAHRSTHQAMGGLPVAVRSKI